LVRHHMPGVDVFASITSEDYSRGLGHIDEAVRDIDVPPRR